MVGTLSKPKSYCIPFENTNKGKRIYVAVKAEYNGRGLDRSYKPLPWASKQFLPNMPGAFGGNEIDWPYVKGGYPVNYTTKNASTSCREETLVREMREESGGKLELTITNALGVPDYAALDDKSNAMKFYALPITTVKGTPGDNPYYPKSNSTPTPHTWPDSKKYAYSENIKTCSIDVSSLVKGESDDGIATLLFKGIGIRTVANADLLAWKDSGTGKAILAIVKSKFGI